MIVFLDTEFTDLLNSELLSHGLVTLDGREHYCELDLASETGNARVKAPSDFGRHGGVLDFWGLIPDSTSNELEMGRRTGEWLLGLSPESGNSTVIVPGELDVQRDYRQKNIDVFKDVEQ